MLIKIVNIFVIRTSFLALKQLFIVFVLLKGNHYQNKTEYFYVQILDFPTHEVGYELLFTSQNEEVTECELSVN